VGFLKKILFSALLLLVVTGPNAVGGDVTENKREIPTEYKVKAAYLFNFARFVEWPTETLPDPTTPIVIGILGKDRFTATLQESLVGATVEGHPIQVRNLILLNEADQVHILFIARSEEDEMSFILQTMRHKPVLTVSDLNQFLDMGGMVRFTVDKSRVKFTVNLPVVQKSNLKVSSQMLQYAKLVE
jgi:hypothetical protein